MPFGILCGMSNLKSTIASLATSFAQDVVNALRGVSIEELFAVTSGTASPARRGPGRPRKVQGAAAAPAAPSGPKAVKSKVRGGRLPRRTKEDIADLVNTIAATIKKSGGPMRSEQIRDALSLDAKEMPRALQQGLADGVLKRKGEKRATTYTAAK